MFFREGEMLTFPGTKLHRDYARYNQIAKNMYASKLGELAVDGFYRMGERSATSSSRSIELSLWRVTDKNVRAPERGVDSSKYILTKPNRERVSYIVVPRMNTDGRDAHPCEYTTKKDRTFEDINDPRVIVIARGYKGMVSEIAKDLVLKNEKEIREGYRYLADEENEKYCPFSNTQLLTAITGQALQMFDQNAYQTCLEASSQQPSSPFYAFVDPVMQLVNDDNPLSFIQAQTGGVEETDFTEKGEEYVPYNLEDTATSNPSQVATDEFPPTYNQESKVLDLLKQSPVAESAFVEAETLDIQQ